MSDLTKKLKSLPSSPGVYIFKDKTGTVLYVGKAGSLKDRVGSYFVGTAYMRSGNGNAHVRSLQANRPIEFFVNEINDLEIQKTDTVLEAYILEQELIKKLQPKYNVDGKDDKSFCYVLVTKEDYSRILIMRKTDIAQISNSQFLISNKIPNSKLQISNKFKIQNSKLKIQSDRIYGPYTSKKQLEIALKILRKIFPYHSKPQKTEKGCLDYQIGLCPGPYDGAISKEDYKKNILGIRMILEGRKKSLINRMKKDMERYSKNQDFENAARIRNQIFALQHVQDIALIARGDENFEFRISNFETNPNLKNSNLKINSKFKIQNSKFRIEGYDISNISGKYSVGSMVVFDNSNGEIQSNKSQYRKFKIKTIEGANDVGAMAEVLARRFRNNWPRPNLIILDGGAGHLNMARKILRNYKIEIPLLAVAKGSTCKKLDLRSFGTVPKISKEIIEQVRDEAHRFAIRYHRKLRGVRMID